MASTKIKLGGQEYDVPMLNIGQIEEMSEIENLAPLKRTLGTIRIALKRATPKVDEFTEIETTAEEIGIAFGRIMIAAGLAKEPGEAEGPNGSPPGPKARGKKRAS